MSNDNVYIIPMQTHSCLQRCSSFPCRHAHPFRIVHPPPPPKAHMSIPSALFSPPPTKHTCPYLQHCSPISSYLQHCSPLSCRHADMPVHSALVTYPLQTCPYLQHCSPHPPKAHMSIPSALLAPYYADMPIPLALFTPLMRTCPYFQHC